jgi:hypothetical protein
MSTRTRGRNECVRALRKLAAFVDDMSDEDFEEFVHGSAKIALLRSSGRPAEATKRIDDQSLLAELRTSSSRHGALELLRSEKRSKAMLMQLARSLHVHVSKSDNLEAIEEKIVENVIGARLRSEAIQGVSLKGSSSESPSRLDSEEESSGLRPSKEPRPHGNGKRTMGRAEREQLRNKLVSLSNAIFTDVRASEWWLHALKADVPEILDALDTVISALPDSGELHRTARALRAEFERVTDAVRNGISIDADQSRSVAAALNDVAGTLMRIT